MIKKIHIFCFCFLFLLLIGSVSAENIENKTTENDLTQLSEISEISNENIGNYAEKTYDNPILVTKDIEMYYKDGTNYTVQITDGLKPLDNQKVNISILGETYLKTTNSTGYAKLSLDLLPGQYTIESSCIFDNRQLSIKSLINVKEMNTTLIGQEKVELGYKTESYTVQLLGGNNQPLQNKEIIFEIIGKKYTITTNNNGQASLPINLIPGTYQITTYYKGENNIKKSNQLKATITVQKYDTTLITDDPILKYKNGAFSATLTNSKNQPMKNTEIEFHIIGKKYTITTNNTGQASLPINLLPGNYTITTKFTGNIEYNPTTTTNKITVEKYDTTLITTDTTLEYKNGAFSATLTNSKNQPMKNTEIEFHIIGKKYTITTNNTGQASLPINLLPGNYTITTKFTGNIEYNPTTTTNNIIVVKNYQNAEEKNFTIEKKEESYNGNKLISQDIDMYYNDGTSYIVQLLNENTTLSNHPINITILGKTYTIYTDENGTAKFPIELDSNLYTIVTSCICDNKKLSMTNYINVKKMNSTLIGQEKLELGYKTESYTVQLLDTTNKPLQNKEIIFEIIGKKYTITTNNNGQASLPINLIPGTYQIIAYYEGEDNIKKSNQINTNITVKKYDTTLITDDPILEYKNGAFTAILTNSKNQPMKNTEIEFHIIGKKYTITTNNTGQASLPINLLPGNYTITTKFTGNIGYSPITTTNKITVEKNKINITNDYFETYFGDVNQYLIPVKNSNSNKDIADLDLKIGVYDSTGLVKTYDARTSLDGVARIVFDLMPGTYTLKTSPSNVNYIGESVQSIKINQTDVVVKSKDLVLNRKGEDYCVEFRNAMNNHPLANQTVYISIISKTYTITTNNFGVAKLPINLNNGNYTVKYNFSSNPGYVPAIGLNCIVRNDEILDSNIEILNTDILRRGTNLEVKLTDSNGIALKNKNVQFHIINKVYTIKTDENGIAKLQINLLDGKYPFTVEFNGNNLFRSFSISDMLIVNTTADFSYSLTIPTNKVYNNKTLNFYRLLVCEYDNKEYKFDYGVDEKGYTPIKKGVDYFITAYGLQYNHDMEKQGLNVKINDDNFNITFTGKLFNDLNQFSVIYSSQDYWEYINIVLNNEVVAKIAISDKYYYIDELMAVNPPLLISDEDVQTVLKTKENTVDRVLQIFYGDPLLEEEKIDEPYEVIQSFAISSQIITDKQMNDAIEKGWNHNPDYEEYAYELFISGLITTFYADNWANEIGNDLNITWNKKENIVLITRDWLGLSCHSVGDINAYGNETDVKNFYLNYGLMYATFEQLGIQFTGNYAVSAVSEIFDGILNKNESFVIEENKDSIILRLVNSTNRIEINTTTGKTKVILDNINYLPFQTLKGARALKLVNKIKSTTTFGYTLSSFKHGVKGIIKTMSQALRNLPLLIDYGVRGASTIGPAIKGLSMISKPAAYFSIIGILITEGELIVDYRNKFASHDTYQYFSYHPNSIGSKTIHVLNEKTGCVDCVEIPIKDFTGLDMDNAIYIDGKTGSRKLTEQEKIKYKNYDSKYN